MNSILACSTSSACSPIFFSLLLPAPTTQLQSSPASVTFSSFPCQLLQHHPMKLLNFKFSEQDAPDKALSSSLSLARLWQQCLVRLKVCKYCNFFLGHRKKKNSEQAWKYTEKNKITFLKSFFCHFYVLTCHHMELVAQRLVNNHIPLHLWLLLSWAFLKYLSNHSLSLLKQQMELPTFNFMLEFCSNLLTAWTLFSWGFNLMVEPNYITVLYSSRDICNMILNVKTHAWIM